MSSTHEPQPAQTRQLADGPTPTRAWAAARGRHFVSDAGPDEGPDLTDTIHSALDHLDSRLAVEHQRTLMLKDPAMTQTLSRVRDLLRRLLRYASDATLDPHWLEATARLVERMATTSTRSSEDAWDLAEELEVTQLWLMPDEDLAAQLQTYRSARGGLLTNEAVDALLAKASNPTPAWRRRVIALLRRLHDERVSRVRQEEAHDLQWSRSMAVIGLLLIALLELAVAVGFAAPTVAALPAGALGATLSGAYRLRDQRFRLGGGRFAMFLVLQPAVGATVAFVVALAATAGLVESSPAALPLLGFVAGFAEPFVIRTLERLGEAGRPTFRGF